MLQCRPDSDSVNESLSKRVSDQDSKAPAQTALGPTMQKCIWRTDMIALCIPEVECFVLLDDIDEAAADWRL